QSAVPRAAVDSGFGVEVQHAPNDETREMIVTAGGDIDAFDAVEELAHQAPQSARWRFIALIPARGFRFVVENQWPNSRCVDPAFQSDEIKSAAQHIRNLLSAFDSSRRGAGMERQRQNNSRCRARRT